MKSSAPWTWALMFAGVVCGLITSQVSAGEVPRRPSAIIAGRHVAQDGSILGGVAVGVNEGRIQSVTPTEGCPDQANVDCYPQGVLTPGLIDVLSQAGARSNLIEMSKSIDPYVSAISSLDLEHRDFEDLQEAGITTVMLVPSARNVVSGCAAVVKTARTSVCDPVLRSEGPLTFSVGSPVWSYDRAPTSRIGTLSMLRDALDAGSQGKPEARIQALNAGRLDALLFCSEPMDVSTALRAFAERNIPVAIAHTSDEKDIGPELARWSRAVIIGPYSMDMDPKTLATAASYASAGVPLVFAGRTPHHSPHGLRMTAALAVQYGLNPNTARNAMTTIPATLAGVSKRIGSIHEGMDADVVVFSDDPLRPSARVLAVYIDGVKINIDRDNHVNSGRGAS